MSALRSQLSDLGHDLRHAVRAVGANRTSRRFSLLVIATMAIGIGTTVGVFAFLSYFLRPTIDAPGEERLVWIQRVTEEGAAPGTSLEDWRDLESGTGGLFDRLAGWRLFGASVEGPSRTRLAWGHAVSGGYFELFGARPELGRLLGPTDDRPGAAPVLVLSHLTWRAQFDADPQVVGATVLLNGKLPFTVVGVARDGFQGEGIWTGIYLPIATAGTLVAANREVSSMGRLRSGVGRDQAEARLAELARGFDELRPQESGKRQLRLFLTTAFDPSLSGDQLYAAARVLMVAVSLLLALACANVANLLLARGAARRRELAVHAALGAGRLRLARRLGIESLLLALAGGTLGLFLARGLTRLIERYLRFEIPMSMGDWAAGTTLTLDEGEIALFVVAVSAASGLLFGFAPVLQIARTDLVQALRGGVATGRAGWRARHALLALQLALSVALLSGGSLLARTLFAARSVELGFDRHDLVMATLYVPRERAAAGGERLQDELVRLVRELPGVEAAGLVASVPFSVVPATAKVELAGQRGEMNLNVIGDGYFEALGVPLLEGRAFGPVTGGDRTGVDSEESPHVLILNRAAAERYWPGRSPLGERVLLHEQGFEAAGEAHEVVGVVADSRFEPAAREIEPLAYLPISQHPRARATILIRARTAIAAPFHDLLRTRYPDLALVGLAPFEEQMSRGLATQTMNAELSLGLAVVGLLFAVVGIYSVVSYTVAQRAKEIGIRLSVGAESTDIRRWALATAARPLAWGLAIGVSAALGLGALLESLLVGVTGRDPVTFVVVPIVLAAAALLAAWVPARRATQVQPSVVLRDS